MLLSLCHYIVLLTRVVGARAQIFTAIIQFPRRDSLAGIVPDGEGSPSFFLPTVDMAKILRDMGSPFEIDYISLDVEGSGNGTQKEPN